MISLYKNIYYGCGAPQKQFGYLAESRVKINLILFLL